MVYKIRVILNIEEDTIRDIAIDASSSLEDLHNMINNSFDFAGDEMASFYRSDATWVQGEEFPLFDMSDGHEKKVQMSEIRIDQVLLNESDKMIYVYDFFNMWSFYVELISPDFNHKKATLPNLLFSLGLVPKNAPEIQFESEVLSEEVFEDEFLEDINEDFIDFNYN
jgi:hypothetical protein